MLVYAIIVSSIISVLTCPIGQYPNPASNGNCLSCSSNCRSCYNATNCYYCQSNYYIYNNVCKVCLRDNKCTCNGVNTVCQEMNVEELLLIIAVPIFVFIGGAFLAFCIREKCCRPRISSSSHNYDQYIANQKKNVINHLGIITSMKTKWIYNEQQTIDQSEICSICLDQDCDLIIPCLHIYHSKCLSVWMTKRINCPTCKRQKMSPICKYCKRCRKNYIESNLQELSEHMTDFYILCSFCKEKSNKRIDSLCEMDMNETRL